MAENGGGVVGGIAALAAALTSPAKLGFAAYVLLVYTDKLPRPSVTGFVLIVITFLIIQVVHDDYARILLNNLANRQIPPASRK